MSYPEGGAVNPARFYDSPMARILVVGASGYVGRELCRVATAAGHDVVGTRLRGTPAPGDDARVLDVTDAAAVRALMAAVRPDVVVNTAYMQDPPHARPVNVGGAGHGVLQREAVDQAS